MNQPHGGKLVNRIANDARKKELEAKAKNLFQLTVEYRYGADVEMIAIGAFSPLTGFMGKADCESAIENMKLTNGLAWGIPIPLPAGDQYENIREGEEIALLNKEGKLVKYYKPSREFE